jgi:PAS domain S-box-containing protein
LVHGTDAPIQQCPCTIALDTGKSSFTEYEEKGTYYNLSAWPIIDPDSHEIHSFVHIVKDITDHNYLENVLHKSEQKYHSLFNSIRDAILVADTDRGIIDCNPAFSDLFGYTLEEIKGKKTETVYKDEEEFNQLGKALQEHKGNSSDFLLTVHYKKKNGTVFPGETNVFYLHDDAGVS